MSVKAAIGTWRTFLTANVFGLCGQMLLPETAHWWQPPLTAALLVTAGIVYASGFRE